MPIFAAPAALLPRDKVPQDAADAVRAGEEGALREGSEAGHEGGGAHPVHALPANSNSARGGVRGRGVSGRGNRTSFSGKIKYIS